MLFALCVKFFLAQASTSQVKDSDHVAIIGASFQRLFENSKLLDNDSFIAFATSLCRLSSEVSVVPFNENDSVSSHKSSRVVSPKIVF